MLALFQIAILIMSVVIHEVSHGYAASLLGDDTAKYQGRLTLNPIKHIDPFGSVILPLLLYITQTGVMFGWAKPVPYNPYNLRPGRWSEALVAAAGPASNIAIAILFGLMLRFTAHSAGTSDAFILITSLVVLTNLLLAIFNLVPIPPLDGSKLLYAAFPEKVYEIRSYMERFGFFLVIVFIFFFGSILFPIVEFLFRLITGIAF